MIFQNNKEKKSFFLKFPFIKRLHKKKKKQLFLAAYKGTKTKNKQNKKEMN